MIQNRALALSLGVVSILVLGGPGGCGGTGDEVGPILAEQTNREAQPADEAAMLLSLMTPTGVVLRAAGDAELVAAKGTGPQPDPDCVQKLGSEMAQEPDVALHYSGGDNRYLLRVDEVDVGSDSEVVVSDSALRSTMNPVLDCMGAPTEERTLVFGTLNRAGGTIGLPETTEAVARKVYVERRILGVSVPGDYIVATYSLDGRLFGVHGRWRRADFANSELSVPGLTVDGVLAKAAESLVEQSVDIRPSVYSIEVSTLYRAKPSDKSAGAWDLHLYGRAAIRDSDGNGSGQEGKIPAYDFPLGKLEVPLGLDADSVAEAMEEGGGNDEGDSESD